MLHEHFLTSNSFAPCSESYFHSLLIEAPTSRYSTDQSGSTLQNSSASYELKVKTIFKKNIIKRDPCTCMEDCFSLDHPVLLL